MTCDIILSGVGGQGVLSVAAIIAQAAMMDGLEVRQSEVHGMSQRGGAVLSHLRISDSTIPGDLVPKASADIILSMEPLEALRYVDYLSPGGVCITSGEQVVNIPDYPDIKGVLEAVRKLPKHHIVDTKALAKEAGSPKAANIVMAGAASAYLPLEKETIEGAVEILFASKGQDIIDMNLKAFRLGAT